MIPLKDEKGKKYGRLKVLKRAKKKDKTFGWLCLCDCGKKVIVRGPHLRNGNTKSCGCFKDEISAFWCKKNRITHGLSHTRIWYTFIGLRGRCNNPNNREYKNYGGRGIKCEWKSFEEFYKDMGDIPNPKYSIDRINNNGNYSKKNCRWATKTEQATNRRTAILVTFEGKTLNISTWAKIKKINYRCLYKRIIVGWPVEKALTTKSRSEL